MAAKLPDIGAAPSAQMVVTQASLLEQRQLHWLAAAVVVVSACLIGAMLAYLRQDDIETGERLTDSYAQVIEEKTTRTLQSVDQNLEISAIKLGQMQAGGTLNADAAHQLLQGQLQTMPFARALWVTDAEGRVVHEAGEGKLGADLSNTAYFKTLQAEPQTRFLVSPSVKSQIDGYWLIPTAKPLLDANGRFIGTIAASVNPLHFDKLWQSINLGAGGSVSLFSKAGLMLARSPLHEPSMGQNFGPSLVFTDYVPQKVSGKLQSVSTIDGVERMFSYRTLSAQPELVVIVGQSFDLVLKPWRELTLLAGIIWLAAAIGLVLLSRFLGRAWQQKALLQAQANEGAQRLRLATDAAQIGVWDWDSTRVDPWFASPTYFTMLGYEPSEGLVNRAQWLARLHPDDREAVQHRIQAVLAGADLPYAYEARIRHANGDYRWISVLGRVLARDATGKASRLMGVRLDITERKRSEEALRLSEESLSITLQSIGDAVIATDATGCITRMNPTAERMTGWVLQEARGLPLSDVFHIINAQSRLRAVDPVHLVMEKGEVVGLANHTALLAKDGREYQIFDSAAPMRNRGGDIVGVVLVFSDVTEQYRVREELDTAMVLLQRTGEMAKVGGWKVDLQTMQLTWSLQTCRLHDIDPSAVPDIEGALALYDTEAQATIRTAMQAAIEDAKPMDMELPLVSAQGRPFWGHVQGFAERDAQGNAVALLGTFQDITDRRTAQAALRDSFEHTQTILDNIVDGVVTFNAQGIVESFNLAATAIFGYAPQDIIGRSAALLINDPDSHFEQDYLRHRFGVERPSSANISREVQGRRSNGEPFPIHLSVSRIFSNGQAHLIAIVRDITQQRHDEEEIRRLAFFDPLTGLPNRRLLMDRLKHAMATSARTGKHGALMFLDLDHFKLLNDTQGHDVGDLLLQQTAARLSDCARNGDTVARLGGDEFVVLLEALSPHSHKAANQAEGVAIKLLDAFKTPFHLNSYSHEGTTSIGIVVFLGDRDSMDDLLKKADLAMYQGKSAGRNTARFFDPAMQAAVAEHDAKEKDLRRGIALREFVLHYQIQVNNQGQTIGVEALVRWNHARKGLVTPAHFIAMAEQTGCILLLGQQVLEMACAQLAAWADQPTKGQWTMAVNVSATQFAQANFVANVSKALAQSGANPKMLKLELTESLLVHDIEDVVVKMTALKNMGVSFSLDDFGTGYSSLSYLKRLPLDQLKIDQSFVRDVLTDPSDAVIARTILALGHSLGLRVIAEGVETEGQHAFLTQAGCDTFQGYYFGRPVAAENLVGGNRSL